MNTVLTKRRKQYSCAHNLCEVFVSCSITLWVYIFAVVNKMVKIRLKINI